MFVLKERWLLLREIINLSELKSFFAYMQLGGLNSMLSVEHPPSIPLVSKAPTIILGMDVSHGSPGQSDIPSIAAVTFACFVIFNKNGKLQNALFICFLSTGC